MQRTTQSLPRAGVTLIELLVVITILVMLMAYATSIVKPTLEDRKSRESAQLLNSYFTNAQAKAAELGRPVGVYLERSANDDNKVLQMYTAVTPPPFVGASTSSRAQIESLPENNDSRAVSTGGFDYTGDGVADTNWIYRVSTYTTLSGARDSFVAHPVIQRGDTVKFNYMGRAFKIINVMASNATPTPPDPTTIAQGVDPSLTPALTVGQFDIVPLDDDASRNAPEPTHLLSAVVPFQIFRRPQKSIAAPIELPTGMAIELFYSGFGQRGNELNANNKSPVVIMYRPSGDLDSVYYNGTKVRPIQPLNLLVGSFEYDSAVASERVQNLLDRRNRWITIRPRGGEVFATKVQYDDASPPDGVDANNDVEKSRIDIRRRQRRP